MAPTGASPAIIDTMVTPAGGDDLVMFGTDGTEDTLNYGPLTAPGGYQSCTSWNTVDFLQFANCSFDGLAEALYTGDDGAGTGVTVDPSCETASVAGLCTSQSNDPIFGGSDPWIMATGGSGNDAAYGVDHVIGSINVDNLSIAAAASRSYGLHGSDGNDIITSFGSHDDNHVLSIGGVSTGYGITGGAGNDTITTNGGNDSVGGGDGDDEIDAGAGRDAVDGNDGNDGTITPLQAGAGAVSGSSEQQRLGLGASTSGSFKLNLTHSTTAVDSGTSTLTLPITNVALEAALEGITGGDNVDISGGPILTARVVVTFKGAFAESNVPELFFTESNALVMGEGRVSTLVQGSPSMDTINGGNGNDEIDGGADGDILIGGFGNDIVRGFGGNDTIHGGLRPTPGGADADGDDDLSGGDGDDVIEASSGADDLYGEDGRDVLSAGPGDDIIHEDEVQSGDDGRIAISALAIGCAQACLEHSIEYAKNRTAFGRSDRSLSGGVVRARRSCSRDREREEPHVQGSVAQGRRPTDWHCGRDGQAVLHRGRRDRHSRGDSGVRWSRVHRGLSGGALLSRRKDPRDRRGHERDPTPGDRAIPGLAGRVRRATGG